MKQWKTLKEETPKNAQYVYVKDKYGDINQCCLIYIDEYNDYVWIDKHDYTYHIDVYKTWKEINHKRKLVEKIEIKKSMFKNIFNKKYWIVTCITEDFNIFSQGMFKTYKDAYKHMTKEYNTFCDSLKNDIVQNELFEESATLVYDDATACFEWKITCITK